MGPGVTSRVRYRKTTGGTWVAPGRPPIFTGVFVIGTTRPTLGNTGIPGDVTLRSAAAAGLPTELNGDIIITDAYHAANATAGTLLIDRVDLAGFLKVRTRHPVRVTRSRIRGSGAVTGQTRTALIDCNHGNLGLDGYANVTVEECVLIPDFPSEGIDGIVGHDYTARRNTVRDVVDHFGAFNSVRSGDPARVTIEGNYCDNLAYFSPCSYQSDNRTHNDGVQIQGNSGYVLRGNTILANASPTAGNGFSATDPSAPAKNVYAPSVTGQGIGITPNVSAVTNTVIEDNWLDYGAQTITVINNNFPVSGLTIRRNRFGRNQPNLNKSGTTARRAILLQPGVVAPGLPETTGVDTTNGNVYDDDGSPVTIYRMAG